MSYVTASSMGDTEPSEDNLAMEDDEQQTRNYEMLRGADKGLSNVREGARRKDN